MHIFIEYDTLSSSNKLTVEKIALRQPSWSKALLIVRSLRQSLSTVEYELDRSKTIRTDDKKELSHVYFYES